MSVALIHALEREHCRQGQLAPPHERAELRYDQQFEARALRAALAKVRGGRYDELTCAEHDALAQAQEAAR